MNQTQKTEQAALTLLLPKNWIAELDTLADVRNASRLALIRLLLRRQMDLEFSQLDEHFKRREQIKRTKIHTDNFLSSRRDNDEW